jgi:peroxiredoxin family protein
MLEDIESKIYVCQYMIDIMENMADMYGENYNDFTSVYVYFA